MKETAQKIYRRIVQAQHILLIPHQHPDGDTLGSVTAFSSWLKSINKSHRLFCSTSISKTLHYLPHADEVTSDTSVWNNEVDLVIVFDSGDLRYAGVADVVATLSKKPIIINFDHHATNEFFGDENMVIITESSTTAVLYHFFQYNNVPVTQDMATCLLTGLVTDTDHFTNAATSMNSLRIGSSLIRKGADSDKIKHTFLKDKTVSGLKLWGTVFSRLTHHKDLDIVSTYLTQADMLAGSTSETEVEGIANFLNNLKDGRASLIFKELADGRIKGSFRTTRDDVDVSLYAKALGGGGHKKAAGFTIDGPLESAVTQTLTIISNIDNKAK